MISALREGCVGVGGGVGVVTCGPTVDVIATQPAPLGGTASAAAGAKLGRAAYRLARPPLGSAAAQTPHPPPHGSLQHDWPLRTVSRSRLCVSRRAE